MPRISLSPPFLLLAAGLAFPCGTWAQDRVPGGKTLADFKAPYAWSSNVDYATYRIGDYVLANNVWAKGTATDFEEYVFAGGKEGSGLCAWYWRCPQRAGGGTYSYPQLTYGKKAWWNYNTSKVLPIPAGHRDINVTYDVDLKTAGGYNFSLDVWFSTKPGSEVKDIALEFMIWMDHAPQIGGYGDVIDKVQIGGITYDLYFKDAPYFTADYNGKPFYTFVAEKGRRSGTVNLGKFVGYLVDHGYVKKEWYLNCIEFGNEVYYGAGQCVVKKFSIDFPKEQ